MKKNRKNSEDKTVIGILITAVGVAVLLLLLLLFFGVMSETEYLQKRVDFEPIKEGTCIYVDHDPEQGYNYCLVYDYEVEQIIEVDLYDELIYTDICVGDTIIYYVDYDYCDADFLNVIKE